MGSNRKINSLTFNGIVFRGQYRTHIDNFQKGKLIKLEQFNNVNTTNQKRDFKRFLEMLNKAKFDYIIINENEVKK